jgi:hypothetical protein
MFDFKLFNFEIKGDSPISSINLGKKHDRTNISVLFIDDNDFPVITTLKGMGYKVTRKRDLVDPNDRAIQDAHIVFVDYDGVARSLDPERQGLALVDAIKNVYGSKKQVVLYSNAVPHGFDQDTNKADGQLRKDSTAYDFMQMIDQRIKFIK